MKPLTVAVLVILVIALFLRDVNGRGGGRGGGGRGGGSRGGRSRGGSTSRGRSRFSGSSKTKITKTTPIKPVRFRTPVIKSQAKRGSQTKLFTRAAAGYLVTKYALSKAPVYWKEFPDYGRYMSIPEERAVRLSSERVSLLDANGNLCLGNSSIPRTLKEVIGKNLFELNTTVIYKTDPEKVIRLYGIENTVSLEDIKDKNFTVTTRARYNVTVIVTENTNCTQVERQVNGTMIELFEDNPDAEISSTLGVGAIITLSIVSVFCGSIFLCFIIFFVLYCRDKLRY